MRIAGAPISWGVCEVPGWGFQMSPDRVLSEMVELGLTATEFGPQGWLPVEPEARAAAVKAHTVDLAAGRIRLAEKMLAASEDMLDVIDGPYEVYNFGGKDNTFESRVLDSAPVEVRRNVITTAAITFDKLTRIVEKSDTGLEQAVGVLDTLAEGFRAAADIYRAETPNEA